MSNQAHDRRSLLREENSEIPDNSIAIESPILPNPNQRHAYQRMGTSEDDETDPAPQYTSPGGVGATVRFSTIDDELRGLGIIQRTNTIPRRPVGTSRESVSLVSAVDTVSPVNTPPPTRPAPTAPNSSNPLLSPVAWTRHEGDRSPYENYRSPYEEERDHAYDMDRIEPMRSLSFEDADIAKKKATFAESIDVAFRDSADHRRPPSQTGNSDHHHDDHHDDHNHDHNDQTRRWRDPRAWLALH
jgi:hypothetical protein